MSHLNIAVLGSTNGSSFQRLLPLLRASNLPINISLVLSDRQDAGILQFAASEKLPFCYLDPQGLRGKPYDLKLKATLEEHHINLILLIGFMRILGNDLTENWRMLNIHPSLLPRHAGLMDLEVHQAVIDSGDQTSGCTVHYATEVVDGGPIVYQARCSVDPGDTAESLKPKVQALEAPALLEAIKKHLEDVHHDSK